LQATGARRRWADHSGAGVPVGRANHDGGGPIPEGALSPPGAVRRSRASRFQGPAGSIACVTRARRHPQPRLAAQPAGPAPAEPPAAGGNLCRGTSWMVGEAPVGMSGRPLDGHTTPGSAEEHGQGGKRPGQPSKSSQRVIHRITLEALSLGTSLRRPLAWWCVPWPCGPWLLATDGWNTTF